MLQRLQQRPSRVSILKPPDLNKRSKLEKRPHDCGITAESEIEYKECVHDAKTCRQQHRTLPLTDRFSTIPTTSVLVMSMRPPRSLGRKNLCTHSQAFLTSRCGLVFRPNSSWQSAVLVCELLLRHRTDQFSAQTYRKKNTIPTTNMMKIKHHKMIPNTRLTFPPNSRIFMNMSSCSSAG